MMAREGGLKTMLMMMMMVEDAAARRRPGIFGYQGLRAPGYLGH